MLTPTDWTGVDHYMGDFVKLLAQVDRTGNRPRLDRYLLLTQRRRALATLASGTGKRLPATAGEGVRAMYDMYPDSWGPSAHDPENARSAENTTVAVQTAQLLAELRGKAALAERQRLARVLLDSVSQALFGIGLGEDTGSVSRHGSLLKCAG